MPAPDSDRPDEGAVDTLTPALQVTVTVALPENLVADPPPHLAELFGQSGDAHETNDEQDIPVFAESEVPRPPAGLSLALSGSPASVPSNGISKGENDATNAAATDHDFPPSETPGAANVVSLQHALAQPAGADQTGETTPSQTPASVFAGIALNAVSLSGRRTELALPSKEDANSQNLPVAAVDDHSSPAPPAAPSTVQAAATSGPLGVASDLPGTSSLSTALTPANSDAGAENSPRIETLPRPGEAAKHHAAGNAPASGGFGSDNAMPVTDEAGFNRSAQNHASAERLQFAQRVVDGIRFAATQNRSFRVQLHPPELGALQIEIGTEQGVLTARLEVQNSLAQQMLSDSLGQLKGSLLRHGVALEKIDIQLTRPAGEEQAGHSGGEHPSWGGFQHHDPRGDNRGHGESPEDGEPNSSQNPERQRRRAEQALSDGRAEPRRRAAEFNVHI